MAVLEPQPGTTITLDDTYKFLPHPTVPAMAFAQEGRKAVVYQLAKNGRKYALKIFKPKFRDPSMVSTSQNLSNLALRGLEACDRICFTRSNFTGLINQYPDLEYAVLMPWVNGSTWFDVVFQGMAINQDACKQIAKNTANVLANLERQGYAHCDIAGPNVIVNTLNGDVSFIDVEDMYGPNLPEPNAYPLGTDGYQHLEARKRIKGQWCAAGDRFSAAVLFAEMLGWSSADIRNNRDEEHYFSIGEMQNPSSQRYLRLLKFLRDLSKEIGGFFERAWNSSTLEECPTLAEWAKALEFPIVTQWIPIEAPPPAASYVFLWSDPIVAPTQKTFEFVKIVVEIDDTAPPEAPKFFRSLSTSLAWLPSFGAEGYLVQESSEISFAQPIQYYKGNQTECAIQPDGTSKFYRVCSFNKSGNSKWSVVVTVKQ